MRIFVAIVVVSLFILVSVGVIHQLTLDIEDDTEGGVCDLHHTPYAVEIITVIYGLPQPMRLTPAQQKWMAEKDAARLRAFRNSHPPNKAGGCVARATFAKVNYCAECRKAEEEWQAKHGEFPRAEKELNETGQLAPKAGSKPGY